LAPVRAAHDTCPSMRKQPPVQRLTPGLRQRSERKVAPQVASNDAEQSKVSEGPRWASRSRHEEELAGLVSGELDR
jgi:hypothetical protein